MRAPDKAAGEEGRAGGGGGREGAGINSNSGKGCPQSPPTPIPKVPPSRPNTPPSGPLQREQCKLWLSFFNISFLSFLGS